MVNHAHISMKSKIVFRLLAIGIVVGTAFAGTGNISYCSTPGSQTAARYNVPFKEFTLKNGLRVVLSEDHSAPVVAVAVYYDVGSRDEVNGRSGFAHLFEHMMFQGSENVPKAKHFSFVENNGGFLNGSTHLDYTNYYEFLPSNQLELALWLESDRMRSLKITPENLKNQKEAVKEEKRLSIDNQAYWPELDGMEEMLFHNWAIAHSTMGSMADLEAAQIADVQKFFDTYYAPNNAVLVIVGDIDPEQAKSWSQKYFETIPRHDAPPAVNLAEAPGVVTPEKTVVDKQAETPAIAIGWKLPARRTTDFYALTLLKSILVDGDSARMYQHLVKQKPIALQIQGFLSTNRGPSDLQIFVIYKKGINAADMKAAIEAEFDQIKTSGVSEDELAKIKNQYALGRFLDGKEGGEFTSLQTALGRAMVFGEYALFDNDPSLINSEIDRYMAVTREQIQAVAKKYFTADNEAVLYMKPGAGEDDKDSKDAAPGKENQ